MSKLADEYEAEARRWVGLADKFAMAIITGTHTYEQVGDELRQAVRNHERYLGAAALRRHLDGEPVVWWPSKAPWFGF